MLSNKLIQQHIIYFQINMGQKITINLCFENSNKNSSNILSGNLSRITIDNKECLLTDNMYKRKFIIKSLLPLSHYTFWKGKACVGGSMYGKGNPSERTILTLGNAYLIDLGFKFPTSFRSIKVDDVHLTTIIDGNEYLIVLENNNRITMIETFLIAHK